MSSISSGHAARSRMTHGMDVQTADDTVMQTKWKSKGGLRVSVQFVIFVWQCRVR